MIIRQDGDEETMKIQTNKINKEIEEITEGINHLDFIINNIICSSLTQVSKENTIAIIKKNSLLASLEKKKEMVTQLVSFFENKECNCNKCQNRSIH
jgi:hypothetical protein